MQNINILKLAGLNLGLAALNTILFSPGFVGLQLGGSNPLITAFGGTIIFLSLSIFGYGNYKLITEKNDPIVLGEIITTEDYINALSQCFRIRTFQNEITMILEQIERIEKKILTIKDILLQKFDASEMSYKKYEIAVKEVKEVFFLNIRSILNKINAFDESDYNRIKKDFTKSNFSKEFITNKMGIYNEYISFVKNSVEDNEEILLKLDRLLLELSKFNSLNDGEIEEMNALSEIDELIKQTKLYQ